MKLQVQYIIVGVAGRFITRKRFLRVYVDNTLSLGKLGFLSVALKNEFIPCSADVTTIFRLYIYMCVRKLICELTDNHLLRIAKSRGQTLL